MRYHFHMDKVELVAERDAIVAQIRRYAPAISPLFDVRESLREYSRALNQFPVPAEHMKRQRVVRNVLNQRVEAIFGNVNGATMYGAPDTPLAFNIADHHQVLNHPFLIPSSIIASVSKFLQTAAQQPIVVISSGDVPPNNFFSENGFRLHGKKVPIFATSERELCSYYAECRTFDFVERTKRADWWHRFTPDEQRFLLELQERIQAVDFSGCSSYCDQISRIVKNTWPLMFEASLRTNLPELLYVTQEDLTSHLLLELLGEDTLLSRMLFDATVRQHVLDNFRGIVVTWREAEAKGTHFFWRKYPGKERTLRMYVEGNQLVPHDTRFKHLAVPLERSAILELLRTKELSPSLFTIFTALNFYCGVRPLVGYGSVQYLHLMEQAWEKTLRQLGEHREAELVSSVNTSGFVGGLALFFKRDGGMLRAQYAHDLMFDGGVRASYLQQVLAMPFQDIISVGVPDMYDYYRNKYIPASEHLRLPVTADDLAALSFAWV